MQQIQSAEGVASGTTITNGNSAASGDAFTAVNSTSATVVYDNAHPMHGGNAFKFATGVTSVVANCLQTFTGVTTIWGRFYFWATDFTSTQNAGARLRASGTQTMRICVDSTGHLVFHDTGNSTVTGTGTGTVALSASTYYRVEFTCTPATITTGAAIANVYLGDSLTLVDTITTSTANFGTAAITEFGIGFFTATANINAWWFDDLIINNIGFPGPLSTWIPYQQPRHPVRPIVARIRPAQLVPAQAAPPPSTFVPQSQHVRPRIARWLRWRSPQHVATHTAPPPASRPRPLPVTFRQALYRPKRRTAPPASHVPIPVNQRIRARFVRLWRRTPRQVVPSQVVVLPPPYVPRSSRVRRSGWGMRHAGGSNDGWMTADACLPVTRPNTGAVTRPDSGLVGRPSLGLVARPNTGNVTRPDQGDVDRPC